MQSLNYLKPGTSMDGIMIATVLVREDPANLGRVGVFIPRVMGLIPNSFEPEAKLLDSADTSTLNDGNEIGGHVRVSSVNYLWARSASDRFKTKGITTGRWAIPPLGANVFVFFLDGDPTQLYYLPFGPDDEDSTGITAAEGNPDIEVVHQSIKGHYIGFDASDSRDQFEVMMANGSYLKIDVQDNSIQIFSTDRVTVVAEQGNISLEATEGQIELTAHKAGITIQSDNSEIAVHTSSSAITLESQTGDIAIKTTGGKLSLSTVDSKTWMPNIVPVCPITGIPHGGSSAGILNLNGG